MASRGLDSKLLIHTTKKAYYSAITVIDAHTRTYQAARLNVFIRLKIGTAVLLMKCIIWEPAGNAVFALKLGRRRDNESHHVLQA